jgi:Fibronectin type III domain
MGRRRRYWAVAGSAVLATAFVAGMAAGGGRSGASTGGAGAASSATLTIPEHVSAKGASVIVTPVPAVPAAEFPALGSCGLSFCWAPGEPVVAVGPTDLLETVNTQAAVYSKATSAQLALYPFESFWAGGNSEQCVDPRAIYLPGDNRFAMSCSDFPANVMRFAVTQTSDPTGAWYKFSVGPADDQDKILATSDKFIIAGNSGSAEDIYVFNKGDVLSGKTSAIPVHVTTAHSNLYQAAVEQTYTSNGYFVASYSGCSCDEWLATVSGTPAASDVSLVETSLGVTTDPAPVEPSVPGGFIGAGDLDGRIYDAVYETESSDKKPVIQYSTADRCGSPLQDCVVSARIDLSGTTPVRVYEHSRGRSGWDYTYGAVGLNAAGTVFEAYARSNPSNSPGAAVLGSRFDVTLQPAISGASSCSTGGSPPCDERWGDYLSVAIDPSSSWTVWVTGLYQLASGPFGGSGPYAWLSFVAHVGAPNAPTGASATAGIGQATVRWTAPTATNGSPVSGYVVTPYLNGVAQTATTFNSTATQETITGLTSGQTYSFKVAAKNIYGTGPKSAASAPVQIG